MSENNEKSNSLTKAEKLTASLVLIVLLAYFICFGIINFKGFARYSMSDMYEDTLVARLMWEQKTLFPRNYVFGNQYYVIATPVLSALFYGLTGSQNTSMALATTVMSLLIVLSFFWMLTGEVRNRLSLAGALLALVSCVYAPHAVTEDIGQLFFVMCSYYACYTITLFLVLGDYLRALKSEKLRPGAMALSLALCFATGMQSLRQTCIMVLPILAFELLRAVRNRMKEGHFFPEGNRCPLWRALGYAAANLGGCLLIKCLNVPHETIYSGVSIFDGASIRGKFWENWIALRSVCGFEMASGGFGLIYPLLFVFFTGIVLYAIMIMLRRHGEKPDNKTCCWLLLLIGIAAVVAASLVSSVKTRNIYLFLYYPLIAVSFCINAEKAGGRGRSLLSLALCVLAAFNLYFSYGEEVKGSLSNEPTPAQQVCELAISEGCEYVYGCHSHAAPDIAVWSDGKLIAGTWQDEIIFKVTPYINIQNIYSLEDYSKALFVFMPWELEGARIETEGNGTVLTEIGQFGSYTVCRSSNQLLYPLSWGWYWDPIMGTEQ